MRAAERLGICLGFSLASPVAALTVYEVAPDVADVWFVAVTIGAAPAVGYLIGPVIWPDESRSQAALVGLAATAAGYGARSGSAGATKELLPALVQLGHRPDRLQLGLEEELVDLSLVDRHALLDAELDDLLAIHPELLRELLGRQVV